MWCFACFWMFVMFFLFIIRDVNSREIWKSYTTQHVAVLTIFSLYLQTTTIAQTLSNGGEGRYIPSVLWRRWLGGRKGIRPVKTEWWGAGVVICLERGADLCKTFSNRHLERGRLPRCRHMVYVWCLLLGALSSRGQCPSGSGGSAGVKMDYTAAREGESRRASGGFHVRLWCQHLPLNLGLHLEQTC